MRTRKGPWRSLPRRELSLLCGRPWRARIISWTGFGSKPVTTSSSLQLYKSRTSGIYGESFLFRHLGMHGKGDCANKSSVEGVYIVELWCVVGRVFLTVCWDFLPSLILGPCQPKRIPAYRTDHHVCLTRRDQGSSRTRTWFFSLGAMRHRRLDEVLGSWWVIWRWWILRTRSKSVILFVRTYLSATSQAAQRRWKNVSGRKEKQRYC